MSFLEIVLLGIALSMDAFAVAVTSGLVYHDINTKRSIFIACVFGFMQALMPLIGYWLVEGISIIVGEAGGARAGAIMSQVVCWIAFVLLLFIGTKMIIEAIKNMNKAPEDKEQKAFTIKEVLYFGVATSIDAMAAGVAMHSGMSTNTLIWLHVAIIMIITFTISLIGLFLGDRLEKLFKGKFEITGIIGGAILIILAFWIIISHYLGL